MRNFVLTNLAIGAFVLAALTDLPLSSAVAHEGHKIKCSESSVNGILADIQAMNDGEAKTTAMKELHMAQVMMAKKDMNGCVSHMHNAMEAMEK